MRPRTVVVLGGVVALLGSLLVFGVATSPSGGGLDEAWVSDTPRDNEVNHHAVGVGPAADVVVAPVAEVPNSDVRLTDQSCTLVGLAPENGSATWRAGLAAEDCFTHSLTEPAIGDVDGDGDPEAVVGTTENALVAYDARSGVEEWRVPLATYGYGRPTIANVTSAPGPEVVTSDIDGNVVVVRGNGSVAWRFRANETRWNSPAVWDAPVVDDVDGDGRPEVLVGSNKGALLLSARGTVEWHRDESASYVAATQADDDAATEVFAAGTSALRAYDGASGDREWTRSLSNARVRTTGDADGDGTTELYVGTVDGEVLALDARTGETEWSATVSTASDDTVPPPVLGDVNGDGRREVVGVTHVGEVVVLAPGSGTELARYERNVPVWTFATPADVDDDDRAEILVRYGDGRVVALDYAA
ncbi:FG-GAP-like repeat-containing protein [Halomicrococcus gelatinilyticus]|uniref:FG-GAP-like repeat-containing protein n=1 Tax=Halomicrococcus gelatinilyticus TaxID=1702103 RepID=UPI002E13D0C7